MVSESRGHPPGSSSLTCPCPGHHSVFLSHCKGAEKRPRPWIDAAPLPSVTPTPAPSAQSPQPGGGHEAAVRPYRRKSRLRARAPGATRRACERTGRDAASVRSPRRPTASPASGGGRSSLEPRQPRPERVQVVVGKVAEDHRQEEQEPPHGPLVTPSSNAAHVAPSVFRHGGTFPPITSVPDSPTASDSDRRQTPSTLTAFEHERSRQTRRGIVSWR